jgi:hypothetical protein
MADGREKQIDSTSTSCLAFATAASCATCCLMAWVWLAPVDADEPPRKDMIVYADVMYELQWFMRMSNVGLIQKLICTSCSVQSRDELFELFVA